MAVKSHRVVIVDDAFMLLGKDLVQIVAWIGQKSCPGLLGFHAEIGIAQCDPVLTEKLIGRFPVVMLRSRSS